MKEKPDLKPGDKIGWNDFFFGIPMWDEFDHWNGDKAVCNNFRTIHYKAIKRIRRKKKKHARVWWVNEDMLRCTDKIRTEISWKGWFENPDGNYIRTAPPKNPEGWIKLKEVKK